MSNVVVVVIATYNEADTIREVLAGLTKYPVIVVDDGSPDGTGQIARGYENVRLLSRSGKLGVASAYACGFRHALQWYRPAFVVQMDAGMTHDPADLPRLLLWLKSGQVDLVVGSRFSGMQDTVSYRAALSLGAAWAMRLLGVQVSDATCGFRCWRASLLRAVLDGWKPRAVGFAFQMEMLYRAWVLCDGRVAREPIGYRVTSSSFGWGMVVEALRVYAYLWRDHRRRARGC